eukprot:8026731-Alexandrium_andersonii.AAC.1
MSASLVGSEMCIRDRPKSAGAVEERSRGAAKPRSCGSSGAVEWASCAVSYTHLTLPTICSV